jgi:hypothetical protein
MTEWISLVDDEGQAWRFDATFLRSNWQCVWGNGCRGIAEQPEHVGCCAVGAELSGDDDARNVLAMAACIPTGLWQHPTPRPLQRKPDGTWATEVIDGACVFFNRSGFAGGAGCALHLAAVQAGERPMDWKPNICWQMPILIDEDEDPEALVVRPYGVPDWGDDNPKWWCTTAGSGAFNSSTTVTENMRAELVELLGQDLYDSLVLALGESGRQSGGDG